MRKYIILFFLVLPFLFACNRGKSPDDIIPKDEMISLLTAIHIADGGLLNLSQAPDTLYKYATSRYLHVFELHHTDSAEFRKSYNYYSTQTDEMIDIYNSVLKNLQVKTDSINKLIIKQSAVIAAREAKKHQPPPAAKPVSTFHPGAQYGVGVAPNTISATPPPHSASGTPPASAMRNIKMGGPLSRFQMLKAKRDSIAKAHLKDKHAVSR